MRKIIATGAMTVAALGLTAGAASASTGAENEQDATAVNHHSEQFQDGHTKVNGLGSVVNVSDVLNDASIANNLLAGSDVANDLLGNGVDADVDADVA